MSCCAACAQGSPCNASVAQVRPASPWDPEFIGAAAIDRGHIEGAGVDVVQASRARRQQPTALYGDVVGQHPHVPGARAAKADLAPLHGFRQRVEIVTGTQLGEGSSNGNAVASLPGRYPTMGWDGEPSAASPIADRGGM